jgi:ribosomal protein S18 acetylase RimI-like enzyme
MIGELLLQPVWNALTSVHAGFAVGSGPALRYPAEVVPFAALADAHNANLAPLEELLVRGEHVYLFGAEPIATERLTVGQPLHTLQMLGPANPTFAPSREDKSIITLTSDDAEAMVSLTTLAFPGFFRTRTYEMGTYYGIRVDGELVAMAGERLALPGLREISAVCTHPAHTGKGYAKDLMIRLMNDHARNGLGSFLHVGKSNRRAITLYERLGFRTVGSIALWPISVAG